MLEDKKAYARGYSPFLWQAYETQGDPKLKHGVTSLGVPRSQSDEWQRRLEVKLIFELKWSDGWRI